LNRLEQENSSHGSKAKSTVDCVQGGSSAGRIGIATVLLVVALAVWVDDLAVARNLTLGELGILVGLAVLSDVISGSEPESTLDALKFRGLDAADR
jgi:hypothetical protein